MPTSHSSLGGAECGDTDRWFLFTVWDFVRDLVLPDTDRVVAIQWAVMTPFWLLAIWLTRGRSKDIRTFVIGLAMLNLAVFAARTVH